MTIALVQTASNQDNSTTVVATLGTAATTGNIMVVAVGVVSSGLILGQTLTDTAGNTYSLASTIGITAGVFVGQAFLYVAKNITGGFTSITFSNSGVTDPLTIIAREYSGISASPTIVANQNSGTLSATITSGNISPSSATQLLIGYVGTVTVTTLSAGSGYGDLATETNLTSNFILAMEDQFPVGAGTYSATFGTTASATYGCGIISIGFMGDQLNAILFGMNF